MEIKIPVTITTDLRRRGKLRVSGSVKAKEAPFEFVADIDNGFLENLESLKKIGVNAYIDIKVKGSLNYTSVEDGGVKKNG